MTALLCCGLALLAQPASGDSDTPGVNAELFDAMVTRLADEARAEAEVALARGDPLAAVISLEEAVRWRPADAAARQRLGQVLTQLGHFERAWQALRAAQELEPAREGLLIDLLAVAWQRSVTPSELGALAAALAEARERLGHQAWILHGQARVAFRQRHWLEAERHYRELATVVPLDDELRLELGDLARDQGRGDVAVIRYREIDVAGPWGELARERLWQLAVDEEARRYGFARSAAAISAPARAAIDSGRELLAAGRFGEAEERLRAALGHSPQAAEARLWLAEVGRARGQRAAAELEYLRALALEPGLTKAQARLAELYLEQPGAQPVTAIVLLHRALLLRPDWSELHLHLARAHRLVGELPQARQALETYLASSPGAEGTAEALALRSALGSLFPESPAGLASEPASTEEALVELNRVSALLARGETDAAMAELRRVTVTDTPEARNLEGRILHAAGRLPEAIDAFRQSLARDPRQADVHEQLGVVLAELGRSGAAREHFAEATALGDVDAEYQLARLTLDELPPGAWPRVRRLAELWAVRRSLASYLAGGSATHREEAAAALVRADQLLLRFGVTLLVVLFALLFGAGWGAWRRWGGATLTDLVTRHPELSPPVQEVLTAIRHEVLKHHTMALQGILATGPALPASQRQAVLALLPPPRGPWPLADKLAGYLEQLTALGGRAGLRLNLRRRDLTLAPVCRGFALLARLAPAIRRAEDGALTPAAFARLAEASELLNVRAFVALERMVQALRTSRVDRALVEQVFAAVRAEGAWAGVTIAPLAIDGETELPASLVIPQAALADVLGNLLRNALQAEARAGLTPLSVGVRVRTRIDNITGLEQLEIAIADRAPQKLDLDRVAEEAVGHGLGLVRQLVERYDGRLRVEALDAPWSKEVVVSFPRDSAELEHS